MLALSVFKKTKGTGFAYNKALKITPFGRSDAFTRGGFAIMPHVTAPLSLMLGAQMNTEKVPTYSNYSISELEEALASIDKNRYPERRKLIIEALRQKGWSKERTEVIISTKHSIFMRFLLIACAAYFLFSIVKAVDTGVTSLTGGESYTLQSSPNMFYFIVGVHLALVLASGYEFIRDTIKRKVTD